MIAPLPLYHIYAFTVNCMCMMVTGNHNVLITNPRDINGFVKELQRWQFSAFLGLNTLFVALMAHPQFKKVDFSRLKGTNSGGTALVSAVAERWKSMTGCTVVEGYGLTETSPVVCANPHGEHSRLGTVGLPVPGTTLKVIDDEGNALPLGERGELCVKGPQVMKGYWQRPEATAEVLDEEGWLRTGDIAVIDQDGFVSIVDRKKDLIIVSGFNVYPNEIEDVVMAHPKVAACAAIGVADEIRRGGQVVRRTERPDADPGRTARLLPGEFHRIQDAAPLRVPRCIAHDTGRQDPAPGAARKRLMARARRLSQTRNEVTGIFVPVTLCRKPPSRTLFAPCKAANLGNAFARSAVQKLTNHNKTAAIAQ